MMTPIDHMLDAVDWTPTEAEPSDDPYYADLPYETHTGTLRIGDVTFRVARLSNGMRVIERDDLEKLFGGGE